MKRFTAIDNNKRILVEGIARRDNKLHVKWAAGMGTMDQIIDNEEQLKRIMPNIDAIV